jgi:glycosyltransferase involved in cell wall biosynthesis
MVSFYFHPNYSGSAVQAYNLSQHLRRLGVSPSILSANLSNSPAYEVLDGVPVHRVAAVKSGPLQIPSFWVSAAAFLSTHRHEFDVLHAHGTLQHGSVSLVGQAFGKPTILKIAMANSDIAFETQGRVNGSINRFMVSRFDRYIATTSAIAAEMRSQGLDESRIRLIPNGVDTDRFAPVEAARRAELRRSLGLPDAPLVSCVAIINERKNIDGVLRIWREVVSTGAAGHLALIGPIPEPGGPFHARLLNYIELHKLADRVSFLGKRDPVVPYLQASEAFLFPSRQEGMPNSVLEAMACGVPCLVSGSAGTEEIVTDGQDGFALAPEDEGGFARATARLLADRALRDAMGKQARHTILARYSLASVAERYRTLYDELVPGVTSARP